MLTFNSPRKLLNQVKSESSKHFSTGIVIIVFCNCNDMFSCLIFLQSTVLYNWATGDSGQLGHAKYKKKVGLFGEYYVQEEPRRLSKSKRFDKIAIGHKFTLGLDKNNGIFHWGEKFGKHGFFGPENYIEPVKINFSGGRVKSLAAGVKHAALVDDKGQVYTWGSGSTWKIGGQLGHGNSDDVDEPK